ncbi:MAG: hypothetical protein WC822_06305 [Candidatus Paceibacterota bacterium]|jgi:hypothetical protein
MSNAIVVSLQSLENQFESEFVQGTQSYVRAWVILNEIRNKDIRTDDEVEAGEPPKRAWQTAIMSNGATPRNFEQYAKDLRDKIYEKYPYVAISRTTMFDNLKWLRRGLTQDIPPELILSVPKSSLKRLDSVTTWDKETGELIDVDESLIHEEALPAGDDTKERMGEFIRDLAHSSRSDAINKVKELAIDFDDSFQYYVTTWENRITAVRARVIRYVNGSAQSARWYDLMHDELPEELIKDFCNKLGSYGNEKNEVDDAEVGQ